MLEQVRGNINEKHARLNTRLFFSVGVEARELTQLIRGSLRWHELRHVVHYAYSYVQPRK